MKLLKLFTFTSNIPFKELVPGLLEYVAKIILNSLYDSKTDLNKIKHKYNIMPSQISVNNVISGEGTLYNNPIKIIPPKQKYKFRPCLVS